MSKRIVIVEDDVAINQLIEMNLQVAGYEVSSFFDGEEVAKDLERNHEYDLALLDIMLPGKDGFELMEVMKKYQIPVIYLTAKNDVSSKVKGLKGGAEDYIVKPFEVLELLVRIEKVLERFGGSEVELRFQEIQVFLKERRVLQGGKEVALKPMEFDCLVKFVRNQNIAFSREQLLNEIWGSDFLGESRTIDVHIAQLRKKLQLQNSLITIPRIGYRLEN